MRKTLKEKSIPLVPDNITAELQKPVIVFRHVENFVADLLFNLFIREGNTMLLLSKLHKG
jgi:hypothetical protein